MSLLFAGRRQAAAHRAAIPSGRLRWLHRSLVGWGFAGPATALVVGLSIFPAVWAFLISLQKWNGIAPAKPIGLLNYELMVQDPDLLAAVRHTLVFTVLFVPSSIFLGMLIAVALNRPIKLVGFYGRASSSRSSRRRRRPASWPASSSTPSTAPPTPCCAPSACRSSSSWRASLRRSR
ncbi:hypothetical protein GCM10020220_051020 [Nonomuraea rubra]|uniref:carbohydrate ABC transporter permease n=1 Tax=Nonomuraea rubra TaxID=46180 RepID=UPI0031EBACFE